MRENLFRGFHQTESGKTEITLNEKKIKGEWVYGNLNFYPDINRAFIRLNQIESPTYNSLEVEVLKETVGQYTGLTDKNGKKIFEGDIVDVLYDVHYVGVAAERIGKFEVVFDNGCFMKKKIDGNGQFHFIGDDVCEIIGNIHDNPEYLKESEE